MILDVLHLLDAGTDGLAVENNGAGATLAHVATDLGAGETDTAEHVRQAVFIGIANKNSQCAVYAQPHFS